MDLPVELIQKYRIETPKPDAKIQVHGLRYNDHYIGINVTKFVDREGYWDLYSPGGTVITLFKNVNFIHISCL